MAVPVLWSTTQVTADWGDEQTVVYKNASDHDLVVASIYYIPTVAILGIVFSTICWVALLLSRLKKSSFSHYLGASAVVNSIHLGCLVLRWLSVFGLEFYHSPGWCNFMWFTDNLSMFLSVWFIVAFAIDRYIWFSHPTKTRQMCTPFRAKIVIVGLSLLGLVVFMNVSLTVGVVLDNGRIKCTSLPTYQGKKDQGKVLSMLHFVFNIFTPYLVIMVTCLLIAVSSNVGGCCSTNDCRQGAQSMENDQTAWRWEKKIFCLKWTMWCRDPLRQPTKQQYSSVAVNNAPCTSSGSPQQDGVSSWQSRMSTREAERRSQTEVKSRLLTVVLLVMFVLTRIPSESFRAISIFRSFFDLHYEITTLRTEKYVQLLSQHLFYTGICLQICVYLVFYKEFREVCRDVLCNTRVRRSSGIEIGMRDDPSAAVSDLGASCIDQSYV